jgi:hypothetical protein
MRIRDVAGRLLTAVMVLACTSELPLGPGRVVKSAYDRQSGGDECAITIAAIDSFALNGLAYSLVLDDSTIPISVAPPPDYVDAHRRVLIDSLGLDPAVWKEFVRQNETSVPLCPGVPDQLAVTATSMSALRSAGEDPLEWPGGRHHGTWPNIELHYLASVSRAGIGDDGRQALISVSGWCGGLCGSGWLVVLERDDDRWRVHGMIMTWVS